MKSEKTQKQRKEARKTNNGVAAKAASKSSNGNGNGNGNGSKGADLVLKNGKSSRKSKATAGWGGTTQNGSTITDARGELTLQSVLNEYWKTHKLEIVNDFDIKVPSGISIFCLIRGWV